MKVTFLDMTKTGELAPVYNEQIADEPYCYPVMPEEFEQGIRFQRWEDKSYPDLLTETFIIGAYQGKILSFAHVAKQMTKNGAIGTIRFLRYLPGFRAVGQAVLEQSERYLHSLGLSEIQACPGPGYRFHRSGWGATITNTIGHVRALFGMNGYQLMMWREASPAGHAFMQAPLDDVIEPILPDTAIEAQVVYEIRDIWKPRPEEALVPNGGALPNLTMWLWRSDKKIGYCQVWSMGQHCRASDAQQTCYLDNIGIEEDERGKGLGRYLLQRTHWEMNQLGYRHVVLHTSAENYNAHLLYTNHGYRIIDTTCTFVKRLDE